MCSVLLAVRPPFYPLPYQAKLVVFLHHPTATASTSTSTTPTGLIRILLASGGNFLLPIVLSTAQLAISRQWPDSDIPQNLDQVKVIVNVVGASVTSIVAALNRWHLSLMTSMLAVAQAEAAAAIDATGDRGCDREDGVTGLSKWSEFEEEDVEGTTSRGEI